MKNREYCQFFKLFAKNEAIDLNNDYKKNNIKMQLLLSRLDNKLVSRNFPNTKNKVDNGTQPFKLLKRFVEGKAMSEYFINDMTSNNFLGVVKYLTHKGFVFYYDNTDNAARNGHLEMVKYLHSKSKKEKLLVTQTGIDDAAGNGHLEMVKYIENYDGYNMTLEVSGYGMDGAVKNGHLEMVKYLDGIRYSVISGMPLTNHKVGHRTIDYIIKIDKLEMVKYFVEKGLKIEQYMVDNALINGNLEMAKYLVGVNRDISLNVPICDRNALLYYEMFEVN